MRFIVLNGSPRTRGTVATLLKGIVDGIDKNHDIKWIDVYGLKIQPCIGCMKCRRDGVCVLQQDDAHKVGIMIKNADGLIVGTPTHWGNMSAQLKLLFDRNVPIFMGEGSRGIPIPQQKGKLAAIAVACTTPWPFNYITAQSRGAVRAVKEVLHYGGYKILGTITKPGTKTKPEISTELINKAQKLGMSFK